MVKPPPKGFIQFKKKGRIYLRCAKTKSTPQGVVQCSYCIRKDKKQKYEHIYNFKSLDHYKDFRQTKDSKLEEKIESLPLVDPLIDFISQTHVSIRAACSDAMLNLLRAAFEIGKGSGIKNKEDAIPPISRQALTKYYIKKSYAKRQRSLDSLKGKFASITLDASTDAAQSCLDICISHPFLHPKPILIDSIESHGGTTEDYRASMSATVAFLRELGIKIGGITSDNCVAQVQALSQRSEQSFQFISDNPDDKSIIWVSCICHIIALGIRHFFNEPGVEEMINDFKLLVSTIRKKPIRHFIQATCIAPSNTRWNVIFLQMMWLIKHSEEMFLLYKCSDKDLSKYIDPIREIIKKVMLETIPTLLPSLQIAAAALDEAQSDSFCAAYTFSLVNTLQNKLHALGSNIAERYGSADSFSTIIENNGRFADLLARNIAMMYSKHAPGPLLHFMYLLTPEGRADFRIAYPSIVIEPDPENAKIGERIFNARYDQQNDIIHFIDGIEALTQKFESIEESEDDDDSESSNSDDSESSSDDGSFEEEDSSENSDLEESLDMNDDIPINDEDPTSTIIAIIEEQLYLSHTKVDVDKAVQCFLNWIMESTDSLKITPLIQKSPVNLWTFQSTKKDWSVFSELALRCLSIVASESGVERLFSQHKHAIGNLRRRTSRELRIARLNMKSLLQ